MSETILKVEDLKTSFMTSSGEVQAVRGVSFEVHKGEILGIVGESGSGKSVTSMSILRLLADTARIKNGKIEFEGTDLTKVSDKQMREIRGQKIAMVFQDPMSSLNPLIPVGKQVAEMIHVHHPEMKRDELQAATLELFGKSFRYPFFAGPVGAVNLHYSDTYTDMTYNDVLVRACAENGIAAFTGDGTNPTVMEMATKAIGAAGGCGVPTIKPWNIDTIREKMAQAKASGCFAVAMDVDAAGLPFLKNMTPPAGSKSVEELAEIVKLAERPFIVKGVMTVKGALKAREAGAAAIVVSNHGGRVLDHCPGTATVLPAIADAVRGKITILADGAVRDGVDVLKMLALGADAVLVGRPLCIAAIGGGVEGVTKYWQQMQGQLVQAMLLTGCASLADVREHIIYRG